MFCFVCSFARSLVRPFIRCLLSMRNVSCVLVFVRVCVRSFVRSIVHWFVCWIVRSFVVYYIIQISSCVRVCTPSFVSFAH